MIVHIKMEFDLDTETRQTTNVTPQVITRAAQHLCRDPKCEKPISLDQIYCDQTCFRSHGKRPRLPKVQVVLPSQAVPTLVGKSSAPLPVGRPESEYRQFTFPQLT